MEEDAERPRAGLRERKKAKMLAAIQREALRLFREQGYDETTVEQIAEAAEVSPSTVFRYFPTKEDLVLRDEYDPLIIEAFAAQPAGMPPIPAMRGALRAVFGELPDEDLARVRERTALIHAVPALRAAMLDQFSTTVQQLAAAVAARLGRRAEEFAIRNFAGVLIGVMIAVMLAAAEDPAADLFALLDAGLAHLEAGLPL